ncbi:hypothetical protein BJ165DRAFT_1445421 [Panaeolus papilionaceus]|nr:hypothetical protein BJ165DRAFT_1445421 [Panaeolus papilionaceus]
MEQTEEPQATATSSSLYLDIIPIILSYLASGQPRNQHTKELSNCALVCKDWCHIVRKITLSYINLNVYDVHRLRQLVSSSSNGSRPSNTFTEHFRTIKVCVRLYEDRQYDEWDDTKQLITTLNNSFPSDYLLHLKINWESLHDHHFHDIMTLGAGKHLVGLDLRMLKVAVNPEELASLLCDAGLPCLRELALWSVTWGSNVSPEVLDIMGPDERLDKRHMSRSRTLDTLCLRVCSPDPETVRIVWPHTLFPDLRVCGLAILHGFNVRDATTFWKDLPATLRALAPHLVELDLLGTWLTGYTDLRQAFQRIHFSGLRKLRVETDEILESEFPIDPDAFIPPGAPGTLRQVADFLDLLIAPQLQVIDFYLHISHLPELQQKRIGENACMHHSETEWETLDRSLESLYSKSLLSARFNMLGNYWEWKCSTMSRTAAFALLREKLPKCLSKGLIISYDVVVVE